MASASAAAAIEALLRAGWTTTPIFLPNEVNEPHRDSNGDPAAYVVIEFPGGAGDQITVGAPGSNTFRETGAFMIHVMVPAGQGAPVARQHAETIAQIFRDTDSGGVTFWAPNPPAEDTGPNGNYFGVSFGTPYQYDLHA